jgi:Tol biopolymer transport system component/DNA-binding winged helix-turn-helix (wHTH) protein
LATPPNASQIWRFGVFEVDPRRLELRRSGIVVKLREQSFRILVYLLDHPGEIVTREELRRVLWPSDTYVDFDHSLNSAVMKLREALGDSTDAPLYIETIPKRGYRFVAPLSRSADSAVDARANRDGASVSPRSDKPGEADLRQTPASENPLDSGTHPQARIDEMFWVHALKLGEEPAQAAVTPPAGVPAPKSRRVRPLTIIASIVALVLLAAVGELIFQRARPDHSTAQQPGSDFTNFQIVPVTSALGEPEFPAFSPDGREIAFIWDGPKRERYDVYAQLVGTDIPLRLTYSKSGLLGAPAWSPDGREIAFIRCDGINDGLYAVPALGGSERKLTSVGCLHTLPSQLTWLPDGKGMLMIDTCSAEESFGVVVFSLATGKKECLTKFGSSNEPAEGIFKFSLSPDGRTIAFTAPTDLSYSDVYTISLSGGVPHQVTVGAQPGCSSLTDLGCSGIMWTPDSKSIVFTSQRSTLPSSWHVAAGGGPIERETTYPAIGSLSKDGRRIVYSEQTSAEPAAIWQADLATAGGALQQKSELIHTQYEERDAQPSPDDSQIAWMSSRSGFSEIWMSGKKGASPLQLTHLAGYSGTPRWSPDSKWIVFDHLPLTGKNVQIFVVDSEGRNLHSIVSGPYDNVVPSWSRDGKSIYFASTRTGTWQVWKHLLEGGAELQLTKRGGFDSFESYDGQTVYFSKYYQAGIWSLPESGGTESLVVAGKPQVGYWGHWAITKTGLYLLNMDAEPRPSIEFYNFASRHTSHALTFDKQPDLLEPSLSATADGKTIYYTQYDRQSVIKMMELAH